MRVQVDLKQSLNRQTKLFVCYLLSKENLQTFKTLNFLYRDPALLRDF